MILKPVRSLVVQIYFKIYHKMYLYLLFYIFCFTKNVIEHLNFDLFA